MGNIFILVLLFLSTNLAVAQNPTYQFIVKNDTVVSSTAYEFDIFLQRTGAISFELASLQPILTFNTGISAGTVTFTMNSGTSQLNSSQQPTSVSASGNELRINPRVPPSAGGGTIMPTSPGLRVGRFRLISSVPFANQPANVAWKNTNNPYTKVFAYVSGMNTEITDSIGHLNNLLNGSLSPLAITSTSPRPSPTSGTSYSDTLGVSGGTLPYSWSLIAGALPAGLSFSSAGIISGTTTAAGTYNFTAQVMDNLSLASSKAFSLTVNPAAASTLVFLQQPSNGNAGAVIAPPITVQVKDAFGNNIPTSDISITLSISSGTGTLSGTTMQATNASGLATFNNLSIDVAGSKTLRAASGSLAPDTSSVFTISPSNSKQLAFVQQPSNATAGATITPAVTVRLKDSLGNNVSTASVPITLTITTGTGTLSGTTTQSTNTSGLATFSDLSIIPAGSKNLTASSGSLASTASSAFTISPGPAKQLVIIQQPASMIAGAAISPPVTVQIRDSLGNSVASTGTAITIMLSSGTGTLSGTTNRTSNAGGLATFNDLSINLAGSKTLTASSAGLTSAVSNPFTVSSGAAKQLVFVQQPLNTTSQATISPPVSVQLKDSLGNNVTTPDISLTMTLSSGTGTLSGTTARTTDTTGLAMFNDLSINFSGAKNLTASSTGLTSAVSNSFTISPGPVTQLAFVQQPTNDTAGTVITPAITAQLKDAAGNNVSTSGVSIAMSLSSGTGALSGTTSRTTGANGLATFNDLSVNFTGSKNLTASSTGLTSALSSSFTISAAAAIQLVFVQQPNNGVAGAFINPPVTVQLKDAFTNNVPTAGVSIAMTLASGTGTLSGVTTRTTNTAGLATFDSLRLDQPGTKTIRASKTGLSAAVSDSFTLGTLSIIATVGPNGTISPSGTIGVVQGANQTFTIAPNTGYHIDTVEVDGVSVTPTSPYTFTNVQTNHTISGTFAPNSLTITVQTNLAGLSITVDGVQYTSPHTFTWTAATNHTISTDSIQNATSTTQLAWSNWSDNGTRSHTVTPLVNTTYTANFTTQYVLTMIANPGGSVTPPNGWYNSGDRVTINAIPLSNYNFNVWSGVGNGSYSAFANPATVTMNGPITETANFVRKQIQITIQAYPPGRLFVYDGIQYGTPQTRTVNPGDPHSLDIFLTTQTDTSPGKQYKWTNWSDGGPKFHIITPDTGTTYTAYFTAQFYLRVVASTGGTVSPPSDFQDSGKVVTITAFPNFSYSFIGWKGSGPGSYAGPDNPALVTMNGPIYDTASFTRFPVNVTIQSNPPGRTFIVDGLPDTTSQVYVWISGSTHTIAATDTQYSGTGTRYIWLNWSDGGARSHTIIPTRDTTIRVNFRTQHYLTMNASTGGTVAPSSGWRDEGQVVAITATPNPTYTFGAWNGTGTISYTGTLNPAAVTMNSPITETASFVHIPVHVTIRTVPPGLSYTVDSVDYTKEEPFIWNISSPHTIAAKSPQSGDQGIQYVWHHWSDGGAISHVVNPNRDTTFVAYFTTQYMLTDTADSGGIATPPTGWQDSGKVVVIKGVPDPGYRFVSWNGTGPGEYTGTNNPVSITIQGPIVQTASFGRFIAQVIVQTTPAGKRIIVDDSSYISPQTFPFLTGTTHTLAVPDTQSGSPGTRFVWNNWTTGGTKTHSITITRDSIITANFTTQYILTMRRNPGGTVTPDSGWYNSGQDVIIRAIPDTSFRFDSWAGTGTGSYSGSGNPRTIAIGGPITEIASFQRIPVTVTIQTNPPGRRFRIDGSSPYTTTQTRIWQPGDTHTLSADSPEQISTGVQYRWNNWSDGGSRSHSIIVPDSDATYTANFMLQYLLTTVAGTGGSVSPPTGFQDIGDTVQITATRNPGYAFIDWRGIGSGSYTGPNNPASVTMNGPLSDTAHFGRAIQVTITTNPTGRSVVVDSSTDTTPKTYDWLPGSIHTIGTVSPQYAGTDTQYIYSNWSDSGAISHNVVPTRDSIFVASFTTHYYLTMSANAGGTVSPASGWYLKHEAVVIRAIPDSGYHLIKWTGTGSGSDSGTIDSATIMMDAPISESATFGIILPAPNLSGIADDSMGIPTSPTLSWMAYSGAAWYRLQISADSVFAKIIYDSNAIADTSISIPIGLLGNLRKYYWRVSASVGTNTTLFSNAWKFTTLSAMISPASPLVNWGTGYRYAIRFTDTSLSGPVNIQLSLNNGTAYRPIKDSVPDTGLYYWTIPDSLTYVSNSCKLKIESSLNTSIYGESRTFAIAAGALPATTRLSAMIPFSPDPFLSTEYQLFSAPGIVDTVRVAALLAGTQKTDWRLFGDNGDSDHYLVELSSNSSLTTGVGYWLLRKGSLVMPAFTVTMPRLAGDATFPIPLHAGWNIIANPFDKNVPWPAVLAANTITSDKTLWAYNDGSYAQETLLKPFKGYYFYNASNLPALDVPYPFGTTLPASTAAPSRRSDGGWAMQVSFESDINEDRENYIGISPAASQGYDQFDRHKPPLFLDQGFLYFSRFEWDQRYPRFSSDIRPDIGSGQVWTFEVANPRLTRGTIRMNGIEDIPTDYSIMLVNAYNTTPIDVRRHPVYSFETVSKKMPFKMLVGTNDFIASEISKLRPQSFELLQNFPNPFNPVTSISVQIPKDSRIRLEVYSILGQRIKTLVDAAMGAGTYTYLWDGTDESGRSVATGVYLYRLIGDGNVIQSKKMMFIK